MALRVKCKCGKTLKVSSKHADRKLGCPHCKHPFRISAAKFKLAEEGTAARSPTPQPPPAPVVSDPQPASLDEELLGELSGVFEHSQSDILTALDADAASAQTSAAPAVIPVDTAQPVQLGYARDGRPERPSSSSLGDVTQGPQRGFWADAFMSFVYPVMGGSNIANFIVILVLNGLLVVMGIAAPFAPCIAGPFLLIGSVLVAGWMFAMYLSVIHDTAAGSEDMPSLQMSDGVLEDVLKPLLKYIGAHALVLAPGLLLMAFVGTGTLPQSWFFMALLWLAAGLFLLPMTLLMFSFGAMGVMLQPHLVVTTIFRTFLPYIYMWLMLLLAQLLAAAFSMSDLFELFGVTDLIPELPDFGWVFGVFVSVLDVYLTIVTMRIIGLYYLHFKKRFTIVME